MGYTRVKAWIKSEAVLCIAFLCAAASMLVVPPGPEYLEYVDVRVLCMLFCLMTVVAGVRECGVFQVLAQRMLSGRRPLGILRLALVLLPFFCSMLVTNDVSLITFTPFAILVLELVGRRDQVIRVVVLQTVAANLGSMATPVGNPQNLFLYARYNMTPGAFFALMVPLTLVSLVLLSLAALVGRRGEGVEVSFDQKAALQGGWRIWLWGALFLLCLLAVFRMVHYGIVTAVVLAAAAIVAPKLLRRVDYGLLATFVCFFVFSGNIGAIGAVHDALGSLLEKSTLLCSAAASQVISNVPAAVLLSGLTQDGGGLLAGVNIGGLGTPVASLASLISLKFYLGSAGARPGAYLGWFTAANVIGLAVLLPLARVLLGMVSF